MARTAKAGFTAGHFDKLIKLVEPEVKKARLDESTPINEFKDWDTLLGILNDMKTKASEPPKTRASKGSKPLTASSPASLKAAK